MRRLEGVVPMSWRRVARARVEGERVVAWEGNCWWRMAVAGFVVVVSFLFLMSLLCMGDGEYRNSTPS